MYDDNQESDEENGGNMQMQKLLLMAKIPKYQKNEELGSHHPSSSLF